MARYAGDDFLFAPKLRRRLHRVTIPALVAWGTEDGVLSTDYGRAYADAFGNGQFQPIAEAGHFPHIEQTGRRDGRDRRLRGNRRQARRGLTARPTSSAPAGRVRCSGA